MVNGASTIHMDFAVCIILAAASAPSVEAVERRPVLVEKKAKATARILRGERIDRAKIGRRETPDVQIAPDTAGTLLIEFH